jgi:uncharacterized protein
MKDLTEGMILKGTVRNVIDFGVFVDIGVHQDGLVHISRITDKFIKHPLEAVSVGDIVEVRVISVDVKKQRIQLSMLLDPEKAKKPAAKTKEPKSSGGEKRGPDINGKKNAPKEKRTDRKENHSGNLTIGDLVKGLKLK